MRMRNYEVRLDAKTSRWDLRRIATENEPASVVATYGTKTAALLGAERLCTLIAIDTYTVSLVVVDEHGRVESDRLFHSDGNAAR